YSKVASEGWTLHQRSLDEGAGDMADGDVGFLDALGIGGRDVEEEIDFGGERTAGFAGEGDEIGAAGPANFDSFDDVGAGAAGGERYQNVLLRDKRFDLAGEDLLEAVIVARSGKDRCIGS